MSKRLIKLDELCSIFNISKSTAYRWIKAGVIPEPLKPGGPDSRTSRWMEWEIDALVEKLRRK